MNQLIQNNEKFCIGCRETLPLNRYHYSTTFPGARDSLCYSCRRGGKRVRIPHSTDRRPRLLDLIYFFEKIEINPEIAFNGSPCWLWKAALYKNGYAQLNFRGKMTYGHLIAFEWFIGAIDRNLVRDHLCRRRDCTNPLHLEQVSQRENILRGNVPRTHCPSGHAYEGENLYISPRGERKCRACGRDRERERRRRLKVLSPAIL